MNISQAEIAKLDLKAEDTVVLRYHKVLRTESRKAVYDELKRAFPDNRVVVLEDGMSLDVVRSDTDIPPPPTPPPSRLIRESEGG